MNPQRLDGILEIVFSVATGACIGVALVSNPVIGTIGLAGLIYRTFKNWKMMQNG